MFKIGDVIVEKEDAEDCLHYLVIDIKSDDDSYTCLDGYHFQVTDIPMHIVEKNYRLAYQSDISKLETVLLFSQTPRSNVEDMKSWLRYSLMPEDDKEIILKQMKRAEAMALQSLESIEYLGHRVMEKVCCACHKGSEVPCPGRTSECDFKEVSVSEFEDIVNDVLVEIIEEISEAGELMLKKGD